MLSPGSAAAWPAAGRLSRYSSYGLEIESGLSLDLEPGRVQAAADVAVRIGSLPHVGPPLQPASGSAFAGGSPQALGARVPGIVAAEARDGREIVVEPFPGVETRRLAEFVLQPMLGLILMQRDYLVLHASCVEIDGDAIAIAGFSGQGKSTTAAALLARGHRLLGDDIVTVTAEDRVLPGTARLGLWPDAAAALGHGSHRRPRPEKGRYRTSAVATGAPVPLGRVYILAVGEPAISPLLGTEALPELVRHSYTIRAIRHTDQQAKHFGQLTRLLRRQIVRRLARPLNLRELPALATMIEDDIRSSCLAPRA